MKQLIIAAALLSLAACTLVELTPEGRNVAVMTEDQLSSNCQMTGTTTVSVVDRVVVNRDSDRVAEELEVLASNSAAARGDTIVATTGIEDGVQTFAIYRCR